jgi:hypothetical protein
MSLPKSTRLLTKLIDEAEENVLCWSSEEFNNFAVELEFESLDRSQKARISQVRKRIVNREKAKIRRELKRDYENELRENVRTLEWENQQLRAENDELRAQLLCLVDMSKN